MCLRRKRLPWVTSVMLCLSILACSLPGVVRSIGEPASDGSTAPFYSIRLVKRGETSLLLTNQSSSPFPITKFRLVNDRGEINGANLGIVELDAGDCVVVWKKRGNTQIPAQLGCVIAADVPVSPPVFWTKPIDVYFEDVKVDICEEYRDECLVRFGDE